MSKTDTGETFALDKSREAVDTRPYIEKNRDILRHLTQKAGRSMRFFVLTFGCQQNVADSEKLSGMALEMGYEPAGSEKDADLILVNTCAIREHAENKALSAIGQFKHLKEQNPSLVLGVCGCMPAEPHRREQLKKSYPYVNFILSTSQLYRLPEYLFEALSAGRRVFRAQEEMSLFEDVPISRASDYRAFVSIMYGCNNFCTYCVVPYVRGRERSREPEAVIAEVKALVEKGYRDITLLGQNVNSYRRGATDGYEFPDLLRDLDRIEGDFLLRFMTSHPKDATRKLVDVMAGGQHIAHAFHLPLQSGSDRILSEMNRHYDRAAYLSVLSYLREKMPDAAVTSDIIVGFPGETEEDFEETLEMLRRCRFDMVYSFIYSPRKGTPAAQMENQIPREVQNSRYDRLLALQDEIAGEVNRAAVGSVRRVLCDGVSKNDPGVFTGRDEQNKIVFLREEANPGEFIRVKITRSEPFALWGNRI